VIRKRSCVVWRGVVGKVLLATRWLPTLPARTDLTERDGESYPSRLYHEMVESGASSAREKINPSFNPKSKI